MRFAWIPLLAGCSSIFDLERPVRYDAASADEASPDDATDAPAAGCPMGYVFSGGSHYRIVTTPATWSVALTDCIDDIQDIATFAHLGVFTSTNELTDLASMAMTELWVGLSDRVTADKYKWVTDEITVFPPLSTPPWESTEPSSGFQEQCVYVTALGALHDFGCGSAKPYVCECDGYPTVPANF